MTDEDMAVYRAILNASRKAVEAFPNMEEMSASYAYLRNAFERGDWGVFDDIERETGGAMRQEVRLRADMAALLAEVKGQRELSRNLLDENTRLRAALQDALRYHLYGERHVGRAWIEDAKHLLGFGEGGQP